MKKRILVVEDEGALRLLYEEELKEEGYEVSTARNGREALFHLKEETPDLYYPRYSHARDGWDGDL